MFYKARVVVDTALAVAEEGPRDLYPQQGSFQSLSELNQCLQCLVRISHH